MVPEAVAASVKFNLAEDAPSVKVLPEPTVKLLLIVRVLPEVEAARVQFPFMVKLDRVMLDTAVMSAD